MNVYEKHDLLQEHIEDMKRRLGRYLWVEGCEKTDAYARTLISAIQDARADIIKLIDMPIKDDETE
jgi:hypothetical protein